MPRLDLGNRRLVLLLQGGGALGAYQVGAWQALADRCRKEGVQVSWVGGISIGSINAAIIAGHRKPDAGEELEAFWDEILSPACPPFDYQPLFALWPPWLATERMRTVGAKYLGWSWSAFQPSGQLNFFTSRVPDPLRNPWIAEWSRKLNPEELSFFDTAPLRSTIDRHVDFDSLRKPGAMRLCVGAASVRTGEVTFFDSRDTRLTLDHVMASSALPPAFPPVAIDGEWHVDGGISSNTPIELLDEKLCEEDEKDEVENTLVFLIDLWDRKSTRPLSTLDDLVWRMKSIEFGSRRRAAEIVVRHYADRAAHHHSNAKLEICQVMLESSDDEDQFCFSDADFSRTTYRKLRAQGRHDMIRALEGADRVDNISNRHATLYRYGTWEKHVVTDHALHPCRT